jgi:hypothetical protein
MKKYPIHTFKTTVGPYDTGVEVRVTRFDPGRPAPACSNPDSPAFSDPGDPEEIEFGVFPVRGSKKRREREISNDLSAEIEEEITDKALGEMHEYLEERASDAAEARAESMIEEIERRR